MVEMEVVGRHALLFDDDAMAAFVNSPDALIPWNSLVIDRYDVRHLLQQIPPPVKKRRNPPLHESDGVSRADLDHERYQDLPPPEADEEDDSLPERSKGVNSAAGGVYQAVAFSYGNADTSVDPKEFDAGLGYPGFHPPFPVPESLLSNLPLTEKLHQIIARTATFVSEHGGQSEIVLRVKQGDNPTFGFLMPDHQLHPYFRFLVDHQEILKPQEEEKKASSGQNEPGDIAGGGALSLLGSVYGSGEDEDGALQVVSESKEMVPGNSADGSDQAESSALLAGEMETVIKRSSSAATAANGKAPSKKNPRVTAVYANTVGSKKRETAVTLDKPESSVTPPTSEVESLILEPPSFMKRMVDRIVEFIMRNGKEFEAILVEQNSTNGRFPFLLPSNQYYPYYRRALQKAQESKLPGKNFSGEKHDSQGCADSKGQALEMSRHKSDDNLPSKRSAGLVPNLSYQLDGAYDSERKEKFRMVIGGPKKDLQDQASKSAQRQCGVSADAAAAIVLAATRGLRDPKSEIHPGTSFDDSGTGLSISDGGRTTSIGSLSLPPRTHGSISKPISNGEPNSTLPVELSDSLKQSEKDSKTTDVSVAKAIAKSVAIASATEADSSEASLTKEQKQKAERLKRAKMFAAMIKSGSHKPSELIPRLSVEPPDSAISCPLESRCKGITNTGSVQAAAASNLSGVELVDLVGGEREGSSAPPDVDNVGTMAGQKDSDGDQIEEQKSKKKRSYRQRKHEGDSDKDHKHSRKKHRSEHSSHHDRDESRHRKRHSSSKDRKSRNRHKHHSSSEDEHRHKSRSDKNRRSHAETELEGEDEVDRKSSDSTVRSIQNSALKDAGLDSSDNLRRGSDPLEGDPQQSDDTEVPDELRAKVRAMLLATM